MRNELNNDELDQVVGGTVCISESRMLIMFTDLGATRYKLKCSFNQANMLALSMYEDYKDKSSVEYEEACKAAFIEKGYI